MSGRQMNTGMVLGSHIDFCRGIWKYGSVSAMPQYPVIERFAKEGLVTIFSCDSKDFTKELPANCRHVRLYSRLLFMLFSWLVISYVSRQENIKYAYYFSGSSIFGLPLVNILSNAKTILFYGVLLHKNAKSLKRPLFYAFEKWSLRYVDYVIIGSDEISDFIYDSKFRGVILPIKKGVRLPKPDKRIRKIPKRVIWCGRLEPVKDPLCAIRVFKKHVLPKHPDADLLICGSGSLWKECVDEAITEITLAGQRYDMPLQFQKSSIFLMTSKYEGSPDVCLEAMALGLPIVSTDVGGVSDYVKDNENGLLVTGEESIGSAINYMLDNPKVAWHMGQIGKEQAWSGHDLEKNTDRLAKILVWWSKPTLRSDWFKEFKATLQEL